jgi:hypothetical protein
MQYNNLQLLLHVVVIGVPVVYFTTTLIIIFNVIPSVQCNNYYNYVDNNLSALDIFLVERKNKKKQLNRAYHRLWIYGLLDGNVWDENRNNNSSLKRERIYQYLNGIYGDVGNHNDADLNDNENVNVNVNENENENNIDDNDDDIQINAQFINLGGNELMDDAELYYYDESESKFLHIGKLDPNEPPIAMNTYKGYHWIARVNNQVVMSWVIGSDENPDFYL